jgi:hypothetical protein
MIIDFVHIPKTAGTSLLVGIQQSSLRVILDYSDPLDPDPFGIRKLIRIRRRIISENRITTEDGNYVIYGHHAADRFESITERQLVTILRDPIELLISYYNYTKEKSKTNKKKYVKLSIEEYLLSEFSRNFLSFYFATTIPNDFSLIGFTDQFDKFTHSFSRLTQVRIHNLKLNITKKKQHTKQSLTPELITYLKEVHLKDSYSWYEHARKLHG